MAPACSGHPTNACDGCSVLSNEPGSPCGACGSYVCSGTDAVVCRDATLPEALSCLRVRVGRPLVIRGPAPDELDTAFNEIRLANGQYRGFSANSTTYALEGASPWAMGGERTAVLAAGCAGDVSECGCWLNSSFRIGSTVHGFIHVEQACDYSKGQTHKSMVFATSDDEGLHWSVSGQIITGTDVATTGTITGEGDCTIVKGGDDYYYAYCLRNRDWRTIVARAPVTDPGPGAWSKYLNGAWTSPGIDGDATALGALGLASGRWTTHDVILLLNPNPWADGVQISFSANRVDFTTLDEVVIPADSNPQGWARPQPTELFPYLSVLGNDDGSNDLGDAFFLAHVYLEPNADFTQRYLVLRDVSLSIGPTPAVPKVGIALTRWYSASNHDRWSTTAPVPGNYSGYAYDAFLGYLMTRPHPLLPTNKLEDCEGEWAGHREHLLTNDGQCVAPGYTRLRTAGWVFSSQQPGTRPLYRCWDPAEACHFAANDATCDGLGDMEWLLGYALDS
jgi:hypothetical protein